MNFRTTLVIIILLVGTAGAYFLFFQEPTDNGSTDEKPPIHEVYGIARDSLQQIELLFADAAYQNLKLVREVNRNWELQTPFLANADNEKVKQMLDDILNKRVKHTLEVPELTQYGLDTPNITLSLWTDGTHPAATFFIGSKAINYSVYIKEKSETHIFLIESSALDDLTKSPTDLRDRSVVRFNPETVSNITFKSEDADSSSQSRTVNCEKQGGTWHLTSPIEVKADVQEIERILSELLLLQVVTFEVDNTDTISSSELTTYGLGAPRIQVKLTDTDRAYALDVGSTLPTETGSPRHVYVKLAVSRQPSAISKEALDVLEANSQYTEGPHSISIVPDDIYHLLNKSVFDLRDKRVIDFERTATNRFVISINGEQDTVCTKGYDNIWELQTPTGKIKADAKAVDDLLFGVDSLEAVAFVESSAKNLQTYGLAAPSIKVAFTQRGEEKPTILLIGDTAEDRTVYVKAEHSSQIVRVKRALIDKIALGTAWLRDKQILNFHIDDVIRLTLRSEDTEPLTCQRLGTSWRLTAPVKEAANNITVNAIIYELDTLMADAYVGSNPVLTDDITGFSNPHVQLTVELGNQKVYTLQIGNPDTSGHYYARLQHEPGLIFLLNADLVPKLKTTLALLRTSEQ
ncbi:MAG: DUF4340 domain-containing protein [Candidatus Poribacteria bacterium]|nr:DUF4340 domain-containing protein [Candidatus Poribacteria bacterium]